MQCWLLPPAPTSSLPHSGVTTGRAPQSVALEPAAPLIGLAREAGAYTVMELSQEMATVSVTGGLTEEAVNARLHKGELPPSAPSLHVYALTEGPSGACARHHHVGPPVSKHVPGGKRSRPKSHASATQLSSVTAGMPSCWLCAIIGGVPSRLPGAAPASYRDVWAGAGGLAQPLYMHISVSDADVRDKWSRQMQRLCSDTVSLVKKELVYLSRKIRK